MKSVKTGIKTAVKVAKKVKQAATAVIAVAKGIQSMTAISEEMKKSIEASKLKGRLVRAGYSQHVVDRMIDKAVAAYAEGGVFGDDEHPNPNWQMTPSLLDQMDARIVGAIRGAAKPKIDGNKASFKEFEKGMESIEGKGKGNKTEISVAFEKLNKALESAPSVLMGVILSKVDMHARRQACV